MNDKLEASLYLQIKNKIVERINNGEFKAGDRLPTEEELGKEYSVSRATIRHALQEIENEDIIFRKQGMGTIVKHKQIKPNLLKLTSFSQIMKSRGMEPSYKTLKVEIIDAPHRVREYFGDREVNNIWFVERLCFADDKEFALHQLYLPPDLEFSPKELYEMKSFYGLIAQKHNLIPFYANETLSATIANKEMANALQISVGDPLIDIWRTTYSEAGQIIEAVRIIYIADRFAYELQLYA